MGWAVMNQDSDRRPQRLSPELASPELASPEQLRPELVVVYDGLQECPYLDGKVARMPLEYPISPIDGDQLDQLLEMGYRRSGGMLYRTQCPRCQECIPTRVDVSEFRFTKSMKRVLNRSHRDLRVDWGDPKVDRERVQLFNHHRMERGLSRSGHADESDYREFLVSSCVETQELAFFLGDQLIGIAVVDIGQNAMNAVYTHFDPGFSRYSIGTAAVLHQIQWAQQNNRQYLYLGLYVAENSHLNYKSRFRPQQRLIDGIWQDIEPTIDFP